jgi:F-type H+-transporting ATPase subunit epsilon
VADTLSLEIVTPDGVKLAEAVEQFTAPGVEGEFGVLPQHAPFLTALTAGIVTYTQGGQTTSVAIGSGFAEVNGDKAVLLTNKFVTKEALDPVRVRLDLKEVDEELESFTGDPSSPEYAELVQRELWAATQLELHGDPPPARVRPLDLSQGQSYKADETDKGHEPAADAN